MVEEIIEANRRSSPKDIKAKLAEEYKVEDISESTIKRIRSGLNFSHKKITIRPKLSEDHKFKRVTYCKSLKRDKFNNMIFTDECIF